MFGSTDLDDLYFCRLVSQNRQKARKPGGHPGLIGLVLERRPAKQVQNNSLDRDVKIYEKWVKHLRATHPQSYPQLRCYSTASACDI
jgi:hypothetical protein